MIPVIGKADCLTPDEVKEFKKNILEDLQHHKIKVYDFPDADKCPGKCFILLFNFWLTDWSFVTFPPRNNDNRVQQSIFHKNYKKCGAYLVRRL